MNPSFRIQVPLLSERPSPHIRLISSVVYESIIEVDRDRDLDDQPCV